MQNHKNEPWKHAPKTAETRAKMSAVALSREVFEKLEKLVEATGKSRGKVLDALILAA